MDRMRLLGSWVRRKRFEAQLVALEVVGLWAGAGQAQEQPMVSPTEMLALAGVKVE